MTYAVRIKRPAVKALESLPRSERERIGAAIDALASNPRPVGAIRLAGATDLYRVRVGDYRVLYEIQDAELIVLVVKIGHRREVYR